MIFLIMQNGRYFRKVCKKLYPDEELAFEMMYTLIDVENKTAGINERKIFWMK